MKSEKVCLKWNDFQGNLNIAFKNLREDNDFNDVTLACEDGSQVEAHKVVLAASSPVFQKLLRRNKHIGFSTIHGLGSLGSLGSQHHQYLLGSQDELGSHRFQKACWKQWEPSSFWEPSRY